MPFTDNRYKRVRNKAYRSYDDYDKHNSSCRNACTLKQADIFKLYIKYDISDDCTQEQCTDPDKTEYQCLPKYQHLFLHIVNLLEVLRFKL